MNGFEWRFSLLPADKSLTFLLEDFLELNRKPQSLWSREQQVTGLLELQAAFSNIPYVFKVKGGKI